jgi:hypothetical protein
MKLEFSRQILEKLSNIKFHENPFTAALFHAGEKKDRRTDMVTLTVAVEILRNT